MTTATKRGEKGGERVNGIKPIVLKARTAGRPAASTAHMEELKTLAAPLVEWVRENYGYNTEVHISADFVCVTHDGIGIPYPISEK